MPATPPPPVEIVVNQDRLTPIFNSQQHSYNTFGRTSHTVNNLYVFHANNQYVTLINSFNSDFNRKQKELTFIDKTKILASVENNIAMLLLLNPTKIKIEVSYENSYIITMHKLNKTIFIEQYFDNDDEPLIANLYQNREHEKEFIGSLSSLWAFLKSEF